MKKLKKMVAVLLTFVMAMAMGVTVFAEGKTGIITVNVKDGQTLAGQTVNIYRLFDVTKNGDSHYGYKVNEKYKTILDTVLGDSFTDKTDQGYYNAVQQATSTDVQKFANDFTTEWLKTDKTIEPEVTQSFESSNKATSFKTDDLQYGYYLVCQTGTKAIQSSLVELSDTTATVDLKSEAPSIEKTVNGNHLESVQIGDTITYTITGTIPDPTGYTTYVYKIHDELSEGLDFVGNTASVKIENADEKDVAFTTETDNARKMTLDLSKYVTADNAGKEVTVTYKAKVNSNANVGTVNKAELEYSNNPSDENSHTTTPPSTVKTPTYPLDIKKTDTESNLLAGAKFKLYTNETDANSNSGNNVIKVISTNEQGKYTVATNEEQETATDVIESVATAFSGTDYNLQLNGLKAGTYYLVETEAPDGYNKLSKPIEVKIVDSTDSTDVTKWTLNGTDNKVLTVENSTGSVLPSTGGTGTIIFSIVAGVLILGVAASFIKDRKKEA